MRTWLPVVFCLATVLSVGRLAGAADTTHPTPPPPEAVAPQEPAPVVSVEAPVTSPPQPQTPPAPPPAPKLTRAEVEQLYAEWLKKVRLIEIHSLRSTDDKLWQQGREEVLAIEDEAAIGPLVVVLYAPAAKYRFLLIEALARQAARGSPLAKAYLQEIAVGDSVEGHRRRAIEGLKAAPAAPATDRLLIHLALDEVAVFRDRAATALAALGEKRAIHLLIERLVTEEYRVTPPTEPQLGFNFYQGTLIGAPAFRQVVVQAAAGGSVSQVTIDLPQVDVIDYGAAFSTSPRLPEVQRIVTQHNEILAALKALTKKDFGFDKDAWNKWVGGPEGTKIVPPWEPLRLMIDRGG
jgi:hypothetical protein